MWFKELSRVAGRFSDNGRYQPILPSEYVAWSKLTGNIVYSHEYDILFAMDAVFCDEANKEIESRQVIRQEKAQREAELNSRGRR